MASATYVGTRGERILINSQNLNQSIPGPGAQGPRRPYYPINPNLTNVSYRTNAGDSKYESLQLHLEKRFSRGLTFGASYTYASYLSDVGNPNGGGNSDIQNYFCIACNWGPMPDDYKSVLSINHVYQIPVGLDRKYLTVFGARLPAHASLLFWERMSPIQPVAGISVRMLLAIRRCRPVSAASMTGLT